MAFCIFGLLATNILPIRVASFSPTDLKCRSVCAEAQTLLIYSIHYFLAKEKKENGEGFDENELLCERSCKMDF